MNDATLVRVMHGPSEGLHQPGGWPLWQRRTGELLRDTATRDVLQREKGSALVLADLVNLHDVGVLEPGDGLGPRAESNPRRRVALSAGRDHFERHQALERTLAGLVNNTHASP